MKKRRGSKFSLDSEAAKLRDETRKAVPKQIRRMEASQKLKRTQLDVKLI